MSDSGISQLSGEDLCLACGLCCNGVIFSDVRLRPGDDPAQLRELGLRLSSTGTTGVKSREGPGRRHPAAGGLRFCQPCELFEASRCQIYGRRPAHCRNFECLLLTEFRQRRISEAAAMSEIRLTKVQAEKVRGLLRQLGDTDEGAPLAARFRRTQKRVEAVEMKAAQREVYAELTVAMHDLNLRLSEIFYPG